MEKDRRAARRGHATQNDPRTARDKSMMIWILKTVFGKVIGLDQIPKEKRDAVAKAARDALKSSQPYYNPKTGEAGIRFSKEI